MMRGSVLAVGIAAVAASLMLWYFGGSPSSDLDWLGYGEAVRQGEEKQKAVLIDVYTDWCGWCTKMDRDVYGDAAVQEYLAAHYVIAKLDAEASDTHPLQGREATEREIARAYGVTGYPATVFLNPEGEVITVLAGYVDKDRFLLVLEYIHERHYESRSWEDFLSSRSK
jgi:thioredoxin-related protein